MRLVEIGEDGRPVERLELPDAARTVCEQTAAVYRKTGFVRPWVGYLAEDDGHVVGTCASERWP